MDQSVDAVLPIHTTANNTATNTLENLTTNNGGNVYKQN